MLAETIDLSLFPECKVHISKKNNYFVVNVKNQSGKMEYEAISADLKEALAKGQSVSQCWYAYKHDSLPGIKK